MFALEQNSGYPRFDTSRVWSTLQHLALKGSQQLDENEAKWLLSVLMTPLSIDMSYKRQALGFLEDGNPPWMSIQPFTENLLWLAINELKLCMQEKSKPPEHIATFIAMISKVPWSIAMDAYESVCQLDFDNLDEERLTGIQKILRPVKSEEMVLPSLEMQDFVLSTTTTTETKAKTLPPPLPPRIGSSSFKDAFLYNLMMAADWETLDVTMGQFGINVHPWIMQRFLSVSST